MKKESYPRHIYNKKILKTKIKSYGDESTDFSDKEIPKIGSNYNCLKVIVIDFVLKKDESYYPKVFQNNVNKLRRKKDNYIYYSQPRNFVWGFWQF